MRRNRRTCFKCGKAGHYFAECPKVNNHDKHKFKDKRKKSKKKYHGHGEKSWSREKMKRSSDLQELPSEIRSCSRKRTSSPIPRTRLQARVMKTKGMTTTRRRITSASISTAFV
jgi:hypothetical protein